MNNKGKRSKTAPVEINNKILTHIRNISVKMECNWICHHIENKGNRYYFSSELLAALLP